MQLQGAVWASFEGRLAAAGDLQDMAEAHDAYLAAAAKSCLLTAGAGNYRAAVENALQKLLDVRTLLHIREGHAEGLLGRVSSEEVWGECRQLIADFRRSTAFLFKAREDKPENLANTNLFPRPDRFPQPLSALPRSAPPPLSFLTFCLPFSTLQSTLLRFQLLCRANPTSMPPFSHLPPQHMYLPPPLHSDGCSPPTRTTQPSAVRSLTEPTPCPLYLRS